MPAGRPSAYCKQSAEEILRRVAEGETLLEICRADHLPARSTVHGWVIDDTDGFSARYARARAAQMEHLADEIVEISDDGTNDWQERQIGEDRVETVLNSEHIQRSRLRVDSRKWLLAKLAAHTYGDKTQLEHTGKDGKDLIPAEVDSTKLAHALLNIFNAEQTEKS